jgi:hypothetical protein
MIEQTAVEQLPDEPQRRVNTERSHLARQIKTPDIEAE